MANEVLFIGWDRPVPGREQRALELFQKTRAYYSTSQSEGKIESFEAVLLGAHGGDLNGFVLIRGDGRKLWEFRHEETFLNLVLEAQFCLLGYGIIVGYVGERILELLSMYEPIAK